METDPKGVRFHEEIRSGRQGRFQNTAPGAGLKGMKPSPAQYLATARISRQPAHDTVCGAFRP